MAAPPPPAPPSGPGDPPADLTLSKAIGWLVQAWERERQEVALQLHEEIAQALVVVMRVADELQEEGLSSARTARQVERLHRLAEEAWHRVDALGRRLRPSVLDDLGVVPALASLAAEEARRGVTCDLEVEGVPQALAPETALALFRIAQDALAALSAQPPGGPLRLRLRFTPANASLAVCCPDSCPAARGLLETPDSPTLALLRERARLAGGHWHAQEEPDGSIVLAAELPA